MHRVIRLLLAVIVVALVGMVLVAAQPPEPSNPLPPAIIRFESNLATIPYEAVENREAETALTWQVANLSAEQRVALQIYQRNEWGDVFPDEVLLPADQREIIIEPPLGFGPPAYRLAVLDTDDNVLDERSITIPYAPLPDDAPAPEIMGFTTPVQNMDAGEMASGQAQVEVFWQIGHRTPTVNVTFEQLLDDGTVRTVELPRSSLWLPSIGQGMVAPVLPPDGEGPIRLRLRLTDMATSETLDIAELVLPLTGAIPAPTSVVVVRTPLPQPQPTSCPASPLDVPHNGYPDDGCHVFTEPGLTVRVDSFTLLSQTTVEAVPGVSLRGDQITVNWNVTGTDTVILEVYDMASVQASGQSAGAYFLYDGLAANGSLTVIVPDTFTGSARFVLWAYQLNDRFPPYRRLAYRILDTPVFSVATRPQNCLPVFHFDVSVRDRNGCETPIQQVGISAAFQPFERGYMIWRSDTREVIVLYSQDGFYAVFQPGDYEGLPDNPVTDTPPDGRSKPAQGFGRVWGNNTIVRDKLGWALGGEQAYSTTLQTFTLPPNVHVYNSYYYLTLPAGEAVQLGTRFSWKLETR